MTLLSCDKLSVALNNNTVVDGVSLQLSAGELVGLIGPNGAGKSTVLRALAGVCAIRGGQRQLLQQNFSTYSAEERAQHLAWLAQSGPINWPLSVERLVALGRTPHQRGWKSRRTSERDIVDQVLSETDCQSLRHRDATSLSGGERARVLLARALASEPTILLADEPVAALDLAHQLQTMELLRRFSKGNRACLVVLHDLSLAARYCDKLILMHQGQLISAGSPLQVLTAEALREVYGVEAEIGQGEIPWVLPKRII